MNRTAIAFAAACIGLSGAMHGLAAQSSGAPAPSHRRHHALTYNPVTGQVLLFGGQHLVSESEAPVLDDLWSWDGARWTQLSASTGIGMIAHKLFVDSSGALFTTANRGGVTLRWGGEHWIPTATDTATRREMAAGAWDSRRHRFLLFGGHVDGRAFPGSTWEFNGASWGQVATAGPPPRLGGAMSFDSRRAVMVLFGGLEPQGQKLGDTWEWRESGWAMVASSGPSPRFGAGIAYDSRRGEVVLFGGVDSTNQKLNDTWLWNGRVWRRAESAAAPSPRSEGYLAYDVRRGVVVLFGGEGVQTIPTLGDTWEWDGASWKAIR